MNSSANYVRAIRGPILLIAIGALLSIDHFGAYPFSRTWPVLIIAIGLMKLLERSLSARPEDVPPAGPAYQSDGPVEPGGPLGRSGPFSGEGNQS